MPIWGIRVKIIKFFLTAVISSAFGFVIGSIVCSNLKILSLFDSLNSADLAAWVGAIGSVAAVFSAIWIMNDQHAQSEKNILDNRAHEAAKQTQEQRDRLTICLMIAGRTVATIISTLDILESTSDNDVPWTLINQIATVSRVTEPTLRMPMHELSSIKIVYCVVDVANLSQRLSDCLVDWSHKSVNSVLYIPDMHQTVCLLKPEAQGLFDAINQNLISLNEVA